MASAREAIKVVARFRPENKRERALGVNRFKYQIDKDSISEEANDAVKISCDGKDQEFVLDRVFPTDTSQEQLYVNSAKLTIDNLLLGFNGTIFAYGQTGSGKTHSMYGPDDVEMSGESAGLVPRAVLQIFDTIVNGTATGVEEYFITCSFCELYNEQINDLLEPVNKNLPIRESPSKGIYVQGITWESVGNEEDVFELLDVGSSNRMTASHEMNERSSRSHSIFVLNLKQKRTDGTTLSSRLNLVDLAGSESVKKTQASGSTLKEAQKINLSLSALGKCITALTSKTSKRKKVHVPFRDSKLTRILQESLGGNSRTTLLVCLSPHHNNYVEIIATLRFAKRAKQIVTTATVNEQMSPEMLAKTVKILKGQIVVLKNNNNVLRKTIEWMRSPNYTPGAELPPEFATASASVLSAEGGGNTHNGEGFNIEELQSQHAGELRSLEVELETSRLAEKEFQNTLEACEKNHNSDLKASAHELKEAKEKLELMEQRLNQSAATTKRKLAEINKMVQQRDAQLLEQTQAEDAVRQELAEQKLKLRRNELSTQNLQRDIGMKTKSCEKEKGRTKAAQEQLTEALQTNNFQTREIISLTAEFEALEAHVDVLQNEAVRAAIGWAVKDVETKTGLSGFGYEDEADFPEENDAVREAGDEFPPLGPARVPKKTRGSFGRKSLREMTDDLNSQIVLKQQQALETRNQELGDKVNEMSRKLREQEDELSILRAQVAEEMPTLSKTLSDTKVTLDETQAALEREQKANATMSEESARLKSESIEMTARLDTLQEQSDQDSIEKVELTRELASAKIRLSEVTKRVKELETENTELMANRSVRGRRVARIAQAASRRRNAIKAPRKKTGAKLYSIVKQLLRKTDSPLAQRIREAKLRNSTESPLGKSNSNAPVKEGPCCVYQLDMRSEQFGTCVCGYPRRKHTKQAIEAMSGPNIGDSSADPAATSTPANNADVSNSPDASVAEDQDDTKNDEKLVAWHLRKGSRARLGSTSKSDKKNDAPDTKLTPKTKIRRKASRAAQRYMGALRRQSAGEGAPEF